MVNRVDIKNSTSWPQPCHDKSGAVSAKAKMMDDAADNGELTNQNLQGSS